MSKYFGRLAAVAAILTLAACRDVSPVAPTGAAKGPVVASLDLDQAANTYPVLRRIEPLRAEVQASAWISPSKKIQTIKLSGTGLKVEFPANAVSKPLYVTLIAHPGQYVSYEFLPHGTTFNAPVKIQQDLHNTSAYHDAAVMSDLIGGYLDDGLADLDPVTGLATVAEVFPVFYFDDTDVFTKTTPAVAKFYTTHFSGYVLASGRTRAY